MSPSTPSTAATCNAPGTRPAPSPNHRAPLAADEGLRERSFGVLQGNTFEELEAKEPDKAYRWRKRDPDFAPEGGESLIALRERITATTSRWRPTWGGQIVLVATAA
jgi:probable phosphoglycerate mutase